MKKRLLLVLGLLATCAVQAQWRLGVSAGGDYNFYSIQTHYQDDYRYRGRWGATAAIFTQYNFRNWVALRAEVEMVQKNHLFYRTRQFNETRYTTQNTYIQLPIMTQFSFGGEKVRGFVHIGVYGGYWVDSHLKGTYHEPQSGKTLPIDEKYPFYGPRDQRWDVGLAGGLGIEYRFLAHWAMHLEGRCYYSFLSTTCQSDVIADYRYNTPIALQLGFCYIF